MAQFRKAAITDKGLALIQKTQMKEIRLEFTRIATGAGEYAETEELKTVTELKDMRQEFGISSFVVTDPKTVKMSTAISNIGLQQPYYVGEIGVFAADPDEGEILYSIAVAYPGKADYLPAYNGNTPVSVNLDTYQSVSDAENVTIKLDNGAYALVKDLLALRDDLKNHIAESAEADVQMRDELTEHINQTVKDALQHISTASVTQIDITIPATGWVADTDTGGAYALHTDVAVADATEDLIPVLTLLPESQQAARACGMCTTSRTMDGILRVYAAKIPTADIPASLVLLGSGGGAGGGGASGTGYTLPAATATRLGGVKIGGGVTVENDGTIAVDEKAVEKKVMATPEEVRAMLADVYSKENNTN